MLPEVGASELIVLAAVALIVVGPKDLPVLLRRIGQMLGKMRALASDFRASFDEMARQSELDELRKEVEALRQGKFIDTLGPDPTFDEINHGLQPTSVVHSPDDPELAADSAFQDGVPEHFLNPTGEPEAPAPAPQVGTPLPDQPPPEPEPSGEKRA